MKRACTKTELERYLEHSVRSLRFQKLRRPEEWARYGSVVLICSLVPFENYALLGGSIAGSWALQS